MILYRLAGTVFRRRRSVLWSGFALLLVAGVLGTPLLGILNADRDFDDPDTEAIEARDTITRTTGASPSPEVVVLLRLPAPADSPAAQARIGEVAAALRDRDVASVARYVPGGDRRLVSRDGRSTILLVKFGAGAEDATDRIRERLEDEPGVVLGGFEFGQEQIGATVAEDIARAELFAFPLLFALALVAFRSVVAALLPLVVGATTILLSFLVLRGLNELSSMSVFALNLINGLGLGLAIDYSLFVVYRFREELGDTGDREAAVVATVTTAGRTVLFSAVTVAAALASLLVFPQRFLYSMGAAGVICALVAASVCLTLLPALLGALGKRVDAGSLGRWRAALDRESAGESTGFWYRVSHAVMARPLPVASGTALVLILLGAPFWDIRFTGIDAGVLPEDASARVVDDALRTQFTVNAGAPVYVLVQAPRAARPDVEAYAGRLGRLPGVVVPPTVNVSGPAWRIDLAASGPALADEARELVRAVRRVEAPFPVLVGGETARFLDQQRSLADHLPLSLAILATTTLVILFLMTGSIVLPVKALLMNALTLSAAFGLLVFVFQEGRLEGLFGYTSQGALESSQPVLLFAVAFALSTDYGVFLLGRIKELHDQGMPNDEAVALGLQRTGRIVTFAALLFTVAIGAFLTSQIIFIKELGFGTAAAVLIDATLVRALLVPALMRMLGERNWWAPAPLARLHARLGLREAL
jgi:uncharacterized membrane protein YdfJ with MMPL/SSD domain